MTYKHGLSAGQDHQLATTTCINSTDALFFNVNVDGMLLKGSRWIHRVILSIKCVKLHKT